MKFAQLAALVTLLLNTYGETTPECSTQFQEDCAGQGNLTAGVRLFHQGSKERCTLLAYTGWIETSLAPCLISPLFDQPR